MSNIVDDALDFVDDVFDEIEEFVEDVGDAFEDLGEALQDGLQDLFGIDQPESPETPQAIDGVRITTRSNTASIPVIYGTRRTGGNIVYVTVTGSGNTNLEVVYALAEPSWGLPLVLVNNEDINGAKYGPWSGQENSFGDQVFQPFPELETADPNWTTNHKMRGVCGVHIQFNWNRDVYSGIPKVEFEVQGRQLFDPRDSSTSFTNNPALCIWDYLTNATYGKGLATSYLNQQSFEDAANYCDELITSYSGGPTHKRFECDTIINTSARIIDNLKVLLKSCRGSLPFINGEFYLIIEKDYTPVMNFNTDNIIGNWNFNSGNVDKRYNRIKVVYPNKAKDYASDYVIVESTAFRTEDNGKLLQKDYTLNTITDTYRAIDSASVLLRKSRQQISTTFTATIEALKVKVGDVITITHPTPGWVAKTFRVGRMSLLKNGNVGMTCYEHEPTVYDLSVPNEVTVPADTTLPDPTDTTGMVITGLTVQSDEAQLVFMSDGTLMSRMFVSWDAVTSAYVNGFEVQYKLSSSSNWLPVVTYNSPTELETYIPNVIDATNYDVRVRAINSDDLAGAWNTISAHTVIGKTSLPANVTGFVSQVADDLVRLSWNQNTELDLKEYEIRVGASWAAGTLVGVTSSTEFLITGTGLGTFNYWIKARDTTNNESGTEATTQIVTTGPGAISTINSNIANVIGDKINLSWATPTPGSYSIQNYRIKYGGTGWGDATLVSDVGSTNYTINDEWTGARTYRIKALDVYGNEGAETTTVLTVLLPSAPTITGNTIAGDRVELDWNVLANTGTFPIESFDIRYDGGTGTFAAATPVIITGTEGFNRTVDWVGARRFWIAPIDNNGNYGTESTATVTILAPIAITLASQVIDNNVLLRWNSAENTLPIDFYEIRRGAVYSTAEVIGNISALFFTIFETEAGTYTYWVTGVDTAGNEGVNNSVTAAVAEPPDYVLLTNASDDFETIDANFTDRTLTNAFVNSAGNVNFPVTTTQTWATHFTDNSWTTIQDQINAGFPIYIQDTPASAEYEVIFDYGSVLDNLSVTANVTRQIIAGDPTWTMEVETSADDNTSPTNWDTFPSTSQDSLKVFSAAFRHVKVIITIGSTIDDTDLIEMSALNLVIDVKEKTDAGTVSAVSTDTGSGYANGTLVTLNKPFTDIASILVTPNLDSGTEDNLTAIFNFEDVANPTTFRVLLFDGAGARASGPVSWNVRGY